MTTTFTCSGGSDDHPEPHEVTGDDEVPCEKCDLKWCQACMRQEHKLRPTQRVAHFVCGGCTEDEVIKRMRGRCAQQ
jgi:hypothetical protein